MIFMFVKNPFKCFLFFFLTMRIRISYRDRCQYWRVNFVYIMVYSFPTGHFCVIYKKNYYSKNALVSFYIWRFNSYSICTTAKNLYTSCCKRNGEIVCKQFPLLNSIDSRASNPLDAYVKYHNSIKLCKVLSREADRISVLSLILLFDFALIINKVIN